jgi:hypothetical protein
VLRHRGAADRKVGCEIADGCGPVAETQDDRSPRPVTQRVPDDPVFVSRH